MNKYFLRLDLDNNSFGFVVVGIHEILDSDVSVSNDEYNRFFELQSQGKQFIISNKEGTTLFEIIEEYIPVTEENPNNITLEVRVDNLEQENADLMFMLIEKGVI